MRATSLFSATLLLALGALACAQPNYAPDKLPKGRDYFELRDGLANSHRQFTQEKTGRVVFLGGSITAGGGWRQLVSEGLSKRFPETKFEFINAGIGSMGSVPHAFRLERDVLAHGPVDLLFLEAAVNDSSNMPGRPDLMLRGMEGVVRHMRLVSPRTDIVQLHFVMEPHMADYRANRVPDSIAQHERVAIAYGNPSLNLAKEVTERIDAGEFTWAADFKNLHPSPFGHRLYAHGVARMLGAAFAGPVAEAVKPHPLPPALDPRSYARGRLGDLAQIRPGKGFELIRSWAPADDAKNTKGKKIGTRAGFVHVPALVGTEPGAEFAFDFHGTACGLFIATGPDAGQIEFSVDGRPWQTVETYTSWSGTLHLPWALVLDDQLAEGDHAVRVRILASRSPKSEGTTLRVFHLLLN
jgi:lysophospholipase L1-like esterase